MEREGQSGASDCTRLEESPVDSSVGVANSSKIHILISKQSFCVLHGEIQRLLVLSYDTKGCLLASIHVWQLAGAIKHTKL